MVQVEPKVGAMVAEMAVETEAAVRETASKAEGKEAAMAAGMKAEVQEAATAAGMAAAATAEEPAGGLVTQHPEPPRSGSQLLWWPRVSAPQ